MANTLLRAGRHWVRRTREILLAEGIGSIFPRVIARLRLKFGFPDSEQREFLTRKTATDEMFDVSMRTDTGGIQTLPSLTIHSRNARFGVDHIASDPGEFQNALAALDITFESTTFLDLGAGKGRALLLAARYPFQRIIGVEFAVELHAIAVKNISCSGADPRISVIHGDATEIALPDDPLVIFMFNPFDGPIVSQVAVHALASFRLDPRPMHILYLNPRCANDVTNAGWSIYATGDGYMIFSPPDLL